MKMNNIISLQVMRHQILKQKQQLAHMTIQPLTRLIKTTSENVNQSPISQIYSPSNILIAEQANTNSSQNAYKDKNGSNDSHHRLLSRVIKEKQWKTPSLDKRATNNSQKLVTKQSSMTIEHSQRAIKQFSNYRKCTLDDQREYYKKDEHIQHLLKVNQNLRNLQGKNNAILLKSIQLLRNNQKLYLTNTEPQPSNIRKDDSLLILQTIEAEDHPLDSIQEQNEQNKSTNILRIIKEEAAMRFKEKIKVKQSRKHIYRTLKNKNDTLNKIKLKTHQCTPQKDRSNPEIREQQQIQLIRLHCPQVKQNYHNIRSSNFRSLTKTYYENMRELRVETKNNSFDAKPTFELRTTKCQYLRNDIQNMNNTYKKKSGIQAFEQIAMKMKKNQEVSPKNQYRNGKNVFRELTPWHFEES